MNIKKRFGSNAKLLWHDKKRWCGLPWTFTDYYIVEVEDKWVKFFSSVGFLSSHEEEINMYRIFDISVFQSLTNKMFGVGNITLYTNDESQPTYTILRVKDPYKTKDLIAEKINQERGKHKVSIGEFNM